MAAGPLSFSAVVLIFQHREMLRKAYLRVKKRKKNSGRRVGGTFAQSHKTAADQQVQVSGPANI